MAKKGVRTETSPMTWEQFNILISKMAFSLDNRVHDESKKRQLTKFLLFISVGCYTGLRGGDILRLRWSDILNKTSFEVTEEKTKKRRTITINNNLRLLLKKYVGYVRPLTYNEYLFTDKNNNGVMSIQYVNRKLKELLKTYNIKIKNPSSHTRKTFGLRVFELNFKSDEALIMLSHIFNHSNTSITRRYIGLQDEKIGNVYLSL